MEGLRQFFIRYQACIVLLHEWGERAWPWNVHFVWGYVERGNELTFQPEQVRCDQCNALPGECVDDYGNLIGSCYKPLCGTDTMITRHGLNYDYSVPRFCNEPKGHRGDHVYTP